MQKRIAVYPGSFDPVTFGHLDIIDRAGRIFDKIIVSVFVHSAKKSMFTVPERVEMLKTVLKGRKNIEVDCFEGLLVDYVRRKKTDVVIRGLRAISDFEFEFNMALMNRHLNDEIETFFVMPREEYSYTSSTLVKQITKYNGDVSHFVPPNVAEALRQAYQPATVQG